jgi:hypothetical protein
MRRALIALGLPALMACSQPPEIPDSRFLEIAREYESYGIVDTKFMWVQVLCRIYEPPARMSASADPETHGDKLYLLYAKNWDAYVKGIRDRQPAGQVIVKETWDARVSDSEEAGGGRRLAEPVRKDGKWHHPDTRHALFIMVKADDGWRFGTVSGDRTRVFQSGVIRSCAKCHEKADPDGLFGLPGRPSDR